MKPNMKLFNGPKLVILVLMLTFITAGCSNSSAPDATGTFEATEVTVSAEVAGRILSLDIEEGEIVEADKQIGAIDSVQLSLSKRQLENSGLSLTATKPDIAKQIAAIEEQLKKQRAERLRTKNLLQSGAATTKQLDDIESYIKVLESQLSAQRSTLNNSTRSLNAQESAVSMQIAQLEDRLAKCRISSPIGGTILAKYAEQGELAAVGRPLFRVADLNKIYLRAYITSEQLARIKIGESVEVVAQFGGKAQYHYKGRISFIAEQSEFTPKNIQTVNERGDMVYAIKIRVNNDGKIKIGTYGEVKFK
jgi:HlyD family secretion protein